MATHCKKEKFSWSYSHTQKEILDGVRNWYNAIRKLSPSKQWATEDEPQDNSQEDMNLEERASTIKKKQHEAPTSTREAEQPKGKGVEDPVSDNEEEDATLKKKKCNLGMK